MAILGKQKPTSEAKVLAGCAYISQTLIAAMLTDLTSRVQCFIKHRTRVGIGVQNDNSCDAKV